MALQKPNGSLRPVAVGQTLRRLCSKVCVFCSRYRQVFRRNLGVRRWFTLPGTGPTLSAMTLTGYLSSSTCPPPSIASRGGLSSRLFALISLGLRLGQNTCYRHDSNLLVGSSLISSQRGVQQGDPLGPSFFALALHPCVIDAARVAESRFPGELDYNSFFLDDGVIAGRSPAVQQILATLEERLLDIGLCIARNKTEVFPACTSVQNFSPHDFEGVAWVPHGSVKLLYAAIGSRPWCETLLKRRVLKARNLLDGTGRYPDAQGAFSLLHSCSGWAKVLYLCRTVPPPLQADGLSQADQDIRHSLGRLVG